MGKMGRVTSCLTDRELTGAIVDAAFQVHYALGPGLFESVYEAALVHELGTRGLSFDRQVAVPVRYKDVDCGIGFRADLIVERRVLVELKAVEAVSRVHHTQVLTYLRLTGLPLGLLLNFHVQRLKDGIVRIANNA